MKSDGQPFKGFLISCDRNKEKQAVRDAYNFLTDYIEQIYNDLTQEHVHKKIKQDGKQITLQTQIAYGKRKEAKLLTQVETNVDCMCFIKINHTFQQIDPLRVVKQIMKDVHDQGKSITRYCHRILPVQRAFRAEHFRLLEQLDDLLMIHSQDKEIKSWMLNFKCRNNTKFNYKEVLKDTEKLAKKYNHFPDIYYPQWAISVEISNHLMCLSISENFKETNEFKLHKKIDKTKQVQSNEKKEGQEDIQKEQGKNLLKRRRRDSDSSIQKEDIDFLKDKSKMQAPKRQIRHFHQVKVALKQGIQDTEVKLLVQKIEARQDDVQLF